NRAARGQQRHTDKRERRPGSIGPAGAHHAAPCRRRRARPDPHVLRDSGGPALADQRADGALIRHRYFLALPFVLLFAATLVGGFLNTIDAQGRVIDDSTGLPVAGVSITYGASRGAVSGDDGSYLIPNLPRVA